MPVNMHNSLVSKSVFKSNTNTSAQKDAMADLGPNPMSFIALFRCHKCTVKHIYGTWRVIATHVSASVQVVQLVCAPAKPHLGREGVELRGGLGPAGVWGWQLLPAQDPAPDPEPPLGLVA